MVDRDYKIIPGASMELGAVLGVWHGVCGGVPSGTHTESARRGMGGTGEDPPPLEGGP